MKHRIFRKIKSIGFTGFCLYVFFSPVPPVQAQQPERTVIELLRESAALIEAGKFSEAEPLLRRAASIAPKNSDARNLLGIVFDQQGRFAEAEKSYRAALELNPKAVSPLANLGVLLARSKKYEQAARAFENVLKIAPEHPQAIINLGLLYTTLSIYEKAAGFLTVADKLQPGSFDILFNLGLSLYHLRRFEEANAAFTSAAKLSPETPDSFYYLGLIAFSAGRDETAADFFDKAVSLRPTYAEANFMLGEILRKNNRLDIARDFYEKALKQNPAQAVNHVRLGGVYLALNDIAKALEVFSKAAERFSNIPEIYFFLSVTARAAGDYDLALKSLRRTLALKPENPDALALSGAILADRGESAEAERLLLRAINLDKNHFNSHHDLGRLLVRNRRYEESLPILQRASSLKPENADVHYQLFLTLSRLKRPAEAEREFAVYKKLNDVNKNRK